MKKIDTLGRLEDFFLCSFYPLLFFVLLGILKIVDVLFFQNFSLVIRAVIFFAGVFFGAALGYVLATLIFDRFFPRYCRMMEEIVNEKED
jgi:hypothetical protein